MAADETLLPSDPRVAAGADSGAANTVLAGRYELRGLLGSGGMGSVYRAWDRELQEHVALKLLRHGALDPTALARFRSEVKLARSVTHRNVARTFDIGEDGEVRFLTMELIEGGGLDELITRRAPLPPAEAQVILRQIAEGLAAAHAVGVVHRDLKPANVMLEASGRVVVTDFGIARRAEPGSETLGGAGQVLGTPAYMAPEQVAGLPGVDARADVYAFALIAHEVLLGAPAWKGGSPLQVAAARLYEAPPAFHGVPSPLRELLVRCVAREREHRFADAGALLAELLAAAAPAPVAALQVGTPRPRETRVAVLPFQQGRGAGEVLLDGLAEDLADVLSMTPGLRVRHAALQGEAAADPAAIGRGFGVDVVVVGSVRRLGDQLRVNVRLIETTDGYQLWAGRFDRGVAEALALNDEVAAAVARALTTEAPAARDAPSNPQVIELYLLARKLAARGFLARDRPHLEPLERARSLAPNDPMVLGMWVFHHVTGRNLEPFRVEPEVEQALAQLVARAPNLVSTHLARAAVLVYGRDDRVGAVEWLRRGREVGADHGDLAYLLGGLLLEAGRPEAALALLRRALWSDPSPWLRVSTANVLALLGRFPEAAEVLEEDPSEAWRRPRSVTLARLQLWAGRPLAALDPVDDPAMGPIVAVQRRVFAGEGSAELVQELDRQLRIPRPSRGWRQVRQWMIELYAAVGADDLAVDSLAGAVEAGLADRGWLDGVPLLARLRGHPGFEARRAVVIDRADALAAALDRPL